MVVTLREVALKAGVSRSAVSRAYTPGASVSAKTRAKVEAAARELGYQPSVLASALATGRTKLVGLVSTNFQNPVFLEIFDYFTKGLQARSLRPLLVNLSGEMTLEAAVLMLKQYSVDGVILASSTLPPDFPLAFREAGLPVVHSFGRWSADPVVHLVGVNNRQCGALAAETLLARGYRNIAFLGGPQKATSTEDRRDGFLEVLSEADIRTVQVTYAEAYSYEAGRAEIRRLLAEGPPAEAYFCGDDILAVGVMSGLADAGFNVPGDVGVLGVNDMQMAGWPSINLSTVRQPIADIIDASIEQMASILNDRTAQPVARLFECSVVDRATLRPLASHLIAPDPAF